MDDEERERLYSDYEREWKGVTEQQRTAWRKAAEEHRRYYGIDVQATIPMGPPPGVLLPWWKRLMRGMRRGR